MGADPFFTPLRLFLGCAGAWCSVVPVKKEKDMGTPKLSAEALGSVPRCQTCGSERVVKDAFACLNPASGLWEIEAVFDTARCHPCDSPTTLVWARAEEPPNQRVRELNDVFRTKGQSMILGRLRSAGKRCSSRSIVMIRPAAKAQKTQPTRRSRTVC